MLSPVRLSSVVCNIRAPYSAGWNFQQFFSPFGTLYIRSHPQKILRRSSQGNPSIGGLNAKGVAKYSNFWQFECYISQPVQDRDKIAVLITDNKKNGWQSHNYGQFTITVSAKNVCRGTAWHPRYKYSITARLKFCSRFINSRLNAQCLPSYRLDRKLYMSFRLVPRSVTLNDLERRNGPYFALF